MLKTSLVERLDQVAHEHAQEIAPDANPYEHEKIAQELLVNGVLIALWQDAEQFFSSKTVH